MTVLGTERTDSGINKESRASLVPVLASARAGRMKDFRVTVKLRNERLVRYREELGMSAPHVAKEIGLSYQHYLHYENMVLSPVSRSHWKNRFGAWGITEAAAKICEYHGVAPDDIWPGELATIQVTKQAFEFSLSIDEAKALAGQPADSKLIVGETANAVSEYIGRLDAREQFVIRMRYGFETGKPETLDAIGERLEVQRTRVAQLEARALRKLRRWIENEGEEELR